MTTENPMKIQIVMTVGLIAFAAVLFLMLKIFSQDGWMRLAGADRLRAEAVKTGSSRRKG
jgi:hypothetical protein